MEEERCVIYIILGVCLCVFMPARMVMYLFNTSWLSLCAQLSNKTDKSKNSNFKRTKCSKFDQENGTDVNFNFCVCAAEANMRILTLGETKQFARIIHAQFR